MQFKVPQNVQREDTIIGPITLRQLGILGIGGGFSYILYSSLSQVYFAYIWVPIVAVVAGLTLAFAFLKIHNVPFHRFIMNMLEYQLLARKRIWIQGADTPIVHENNNKKQRKNTKTNQEPEQTPKKTKSLQELSKTLNTKK